MADPTTPVEGAPPVEPPWWTTAVLGVMVLVTLAAVVTL